MAQRCRRLVACAYADSDSESDSESDAREFYETMASRARRQRRKVGHLLLRHATSYNMVCRPHVEFAMPRLSSPLTELSEYDMEMHTRFNKDEFRMILAELRLIPRRVRTRHMSGIATWLRTRSATLLHRVRCCSLTANAKPIACPVQVRPRGA